MRLALIHCPGNAGVKDDQAAWLVGEATLRSGSYPGWSEVLKSLRLTGKATLTSGSCPGWSGVLRSLRLTGKATLTSGSCPGWSGVLRSLRLTGKATLTSGSCPGWSGVLRSSRLWQAKQPSQVAHVLDDLECWGAQDSTCGHRAKKNSHLPSPGGERHRQRKCSAVFLGEKRAIVNRTNIGSL